MAKIPTPEELRSAAPVSKTFRLEMFFRENPEAEKHFWETMLPYQEMGLQFTPLLRLWYEVWPSCPQVRIQTLKLLVDERIASER